MKAAYCCWSSFFSASFFLTITYLSASSGAEGSSGTGVAEIGRDERVTAWRIRESHGDYEVCVWECVGDFEWGRRTLKLMALRETLFFFAFLLFLFLFWFVYATNGEWTTLDGLYAHFGLLGMPSYLLLITALTLPVVKFKSGSLGAVPSRLLLFFLR